MERSRSTKLYCLWNAALWTEMLPFCSDITSTTLMLVALWVSERTRQGTCLEAYMCQEHSTCLSCFTFFPNGVWWKWWSTSGLGGVKHVKSVSREYTLLFLEGKYCSERRHHHYMARLQMVECILVRICSKHGFYYFDRRKLDAFTEAHYCLRVKLC